MSNAERSPDTSPYTHLLARAVRDQFSPRPTLRSVATQLLHSTLQERFPDLALDMSTVKLVEPDDRSGWTARLLIDVFMDVVANNATLHFSDEEGMAPFLASRLSTPILEATDSLDLDMQRVRSLLLELPQVLPIAYQQALIDYWKGTSDGTLARNQWLRDLLRDSLRAAGITTPELDADERAAIHEVVTYPDRTARSSIYGESHTRVYVVESSLLGSFGTVTHLSPDLLLTRFHNGRETVLLCKPSGSIEAFASMDAFGVAWEAQLGREYVVETASWRCYEPDDDVFGVQAELMLERVLADLQSIRLPTDQGEADLEQLYANVTSPVAWFSTAPVPVPELLQKIQAALPDWLQQASAADRFAYRRHLSELASAQQQSAGASFLDGIPDIRSFAAQRLSTQISTDHALEPLYAVDKIQVSFAVPVGVPGGWGFIAQRQMTLVDMALENLVGLPRGEMTVSRTDGQTLPDWLTPQYLKALITQVNIGQVYPDLIKRYLVTDDVERSSRQKLFADQLRVQLPLLALQCKIRGEAGISQAGYRYIATVMNEGTELEGSQAAIVVRPLAFVHSPGAAADVVGNMFVIGPRAIDQGPHILYRPFARQSLTEYTSRQSLYEAIKRPGELQRSVLNWLDDDVRPIYDNNGFEEPHINRIVLDDWTPPLAPPPATLSDRIIDGDYLQALFNANARALIELADRQSVSNAESRWGLFKEGGWLLFNTLLPFLRGPAAVAGWMLQLVSSLQHDFSALNSDDPRQKSAAVVDLLLNAGALLLHSGEYYHSSVAPLRLERVNDPRIAGPQPRASNNAPAIASMQVTKGAIALPSVPVGDGHTVLDFSWFGTHQGLTPTQRTSLASFKVAHPESLPAPQLTGAYAGLYAIDQHWHALIGSDLFRVSVQPDGVVIVDPGNPARFGPWLRSEAGARWALDLRLRLRGGGPKKNIERFRAQRTEEIKALYLQYSEVQQKATLLEETVRKKVAILSKMREDNIDVTQISAGYIKDVETLLAWTNEGAAILRTVGEKEPQGPYKSLLIQTLQVAATNVRRLQSIRIHAFDALDFSAMEQSARAIKMKEGRALSYQQLLDYEHFITLSKAAEELVGQMIATGLEMEKLMEEGRQLGHEGDVIYNQEMAFRNEFGITGPHHMEVAYMDMLAELSLDRSETFVLPDPAYVTLRFTDGALHTAALSYVELQTTEGYSIDERLEVLVSVLDQCERVEELCRYFPDGRETFLRTEYFLRFITKLGELRARAEQDLATLIREIETPVAKSPRARTSPVKRPPHKPAQRRVIKTRNHGALVGDVREAAPGDPGVIVDVRDPTNKKVIASYLEHRDEGVFVEIQTRAPRPVSATPTRTVVQLSAEGSRLLAEKNEVVQRVESYMARSRRPVELEDILLQHARKLDDLANDLEAAIDLDAAEHTNETTQVTALRAGAQALRQRGKEIRIELYKKSRYPTAESLAYLKQANEVLIARIGERVATDAPDDFLEKHWIRDNTTNKVLWEAHFHYPAADTPRKEFSKGHLKLYDQRNLGRKFQFEQAKDNREVIDIYRGDISRKLAPRLFPLED
ncbi:dermonecrotic toxin domain-containing protein [Pseudomonas akapageensis]|uniref:dermonecrotic toxin domain-containing protein n=1 Tax=Pseudomonas akapageensis TaxID=2609961 RepID=UPI00140D1DEB|nr:DUF6543 domain-containing protein [Pseudomonas akapageensis]